MLGKPDRRSRQFIETISLILITFSILGGFLVLIDPVVSWKTVSGVSISIGGGGFGDQLKGAVIQSILFGGFTGVVGYWLGASSSGVKAQESVNTIATAAAPTTAAAVLAATESVATGSPSAPIKTETVNVEAENAVVKEKP